MHRDVIVVGQGLAGSILAWQLIQKGLDVAVIDNNHRGSSSRVSAGLINPITGKRLVKSWEVDHCLPAAMQFYCALESIFKRTLFHSKPILRLFDNAEERALWQKRRVQNDYQHYLGSLYTANETTPTAYRPLGGFYIHQCGYLDTTALLVAVKTHLQRQQRLIEAPLNYTDITINQSNVSWKNISANHLVFCEGHRIRENPWFSWLPLQPAQGEILTVKTQQPLPWEIINRGKWLLPVAADTFKIGATFQWKPIDGVPTEAGKHQLLEACRSLGWRGQDDRVAEHLCGVRPGSRDKKPFIGSHPLHPRLCVFNGFGAKGSLLIPYFAALFTDYLNGLAELPDEVNIRRFDLPE